MNFSILGNDLIENGYTQIDNVFLFSFMPLADGVDVKVYLYGYYMAMSKMENSIEKMCLSLRLNEERIISAFNFWEEKGLVTLSKSHPLSVTYHSPKTPKTPIIKINASKYSIFINEVARLFPEKITLPNEYEALISLMQEFKIETNAMLSIMRYSLNIKPNAALRYILVTAADFGKKGLITQQAVDKRIEELELNNEDIRQIFGELGHKEKADLEDRQLYLKWTKEYNLSLDAILTAARSLKKPRSMEKLSRAIDECVNAGATSAESISNFQILKEKNKKLAVEIAKCMGIYYQSLDMMVETYILPWQTKGFYSDAQIMIARLCFIRGVKTLDGMNTMIDDLKSKGIITANQVEAHILKEGEREQLIKEVLKKTGSSNYVSARDRELYITFTEDWGFSHQIVLCVAEKSIDKPFPMSNIARILSVAKEKGLFALDDIKQLCSDNSAYLVAKATKSKPKEKNQTDFIKRNYTKEQLDSVFKRFDQDTQLEDDENE